MIRLSRESMEEAFVPYLSEHQDLQYQGVVYPSAFRGMPGSHDGDSDMRAQTVSRDREGGASMISSS